MAKPSARRQRRGAANDHRLRVAVMYGDAVHVDVLVDDTVAPDGWPLMVDGAELGGVPLLERIGASEADDARWVLNWSAAVSGWIRWRGVERSLRELAWQRGAEVHGEVLVPVTCEDSSGPGGRWRPEPHFRIPLGGDDWGVVKLGGADVVFQFVHPHERRGVRALLRGWGSFGQRAAALAGSRALPTASVRSIEAFAGIGWLVALIASVALQGALVIGALWPAPASSDDAVMTVAHYGSDVEREVAVQGPSIVEAEELPRMEVDQQRALSARIRRHTADCIMHTMNSKAVAASTSAVATSESVAGAGAEMREQTGFWSSSLQKPRKSTEGRNLGDAPMSEQLNRQ